MYKLTSYPEENEKSNRRFKTEPNCQIQSGIPHYSHRKYRINKSGIKLKNQRGKYELNTHQISVQRQKNVSNAIQGIFRIRNKKNDDHFINKIITEEEANKRYHIKEIFGKGTFGTVFIGHNLDTSQRVAIKKVLQDKKYKNRQIKILKIIKNPNIIYMHSYYFTYEDDNEYLHVIMDYYPYNLYQVIRKRLLTPILVKLFAYQLLRALNYLSSISIAHRDIKPQNVLVDLEQNKIVICDMGSAKQLNIGQSNLSYICSRCYRAPELIFGATDYNQQIDMWSLGCIIVEMINGEPLFAGDSQIDQLRQIIRVLGTPSKNNIQDMNRNYDNKQYGRFPRLKHQKWSSLLDTEDPLLIDLIDKTLEYSPKKRLTPAKALMHDYFDQLRDEYKYRNLTEKLRNIPSLFDFSQQQLKSFENPWKVVPNWVNSNNQRLSLSKLKVSLQKQAKRLP